MNLNQLEYFVNAAEMLNFTKAANFCCISQTAMTQQIHSLEKSLGAVLFIRDKHHVELTEAGRIYLKEARKILDQCQEAERLVRVAASGSEGELTVGYITGFGLSDCPEILRGFHRAYPNIKMKLIRDTMGGLMNALEKRECDAVFCLTSSQFRKQYQGIEHQYLMSYPLMAVLPADHALANRDAIRYRDLRDEQFIIMQPPMRAREQMEELFIIYDRGGFQPEISGFDEEPETILLMVSMGMGICLMPEYIVRHQHWNSNLAILPMVNEEGRAETLDLEIAWARENKNPAREKLLNWQQSAESETRRRFVSFKKIYEERRE